MLAIWRRANSEGRRAKGDLANSESEWLTEADS
jgi:hypothetical protein